MVFRSICAALLAAGTAASPAAAGEAEAPAEPECPKKQLWTIDGCVPKKDAIKSAKKSFEEFGLAFTDSYDGGDTICDGSVAGWSLPGAKKPRVLVWSCSAKEAVKQGRWDVLEHPSGKVLRTVARVVDDPAVIAIPKAALASAEAAVKQAGKKLKLIKALHVELSDIATLKGFKLRLAWDAKRQFLTHNRLYDNSKPTDVLAGADLAAGFKCTVEGAATTVSDVHINYVPWSRHVLVRATAACGDRDASKGHQDTVIRLLDLQPLLSE